MPTVGETQMPASQTSPPTLESEEEEEQLDALTPTELYICDLHHWNPAEFKRLKGQYAANRIPE